MKLIYENEYGEVYHAGTANIVPRIGDTISFDNEFYKIKDVIWDIVSETVTVRYSHVPFRVYEHSKQDLGRLKDTERSIISLNNSTKAVEKKGKVLAEQVASLRQHIYNQINKER